jgi:acyl-CoA reductase-like NAD-dependent aldehyde dehydrogenase
VAIKRVFVHEDQYDEFVQGLAKAADGAKMGDGMAAGVSFGPINNRMQLERVVGLVEDARNSGGVIAAGGERLAVPGHEGGFFYKVRATPHSQGCHRAAATGQSVGSECWQWLNADLHRLHDAK